MPVNVQLIKNARVIVIAKIDRLIMRTIRSAINRSNVYSSRILIKHAVEENSRISLLFNSYYIFRGIFYLCNCKMTYLLAWDFQVDRVEGMVLRVERSHPPEDCRAGHHHHPRPAALLSSSSCTYSSCFGTRFSPARKIVTIVRDFHKHVFFIVTFTWTWSRKFYYISSTSV